MGDFDAVVAGVAPTGWRRRCGWPRPAGRSVWSRPTRTWAARPGPWNAPCPASATTSGRGSWPWPWSHRRSPAGTWPPSGCGSGMHRFRPPIRCLAAGPSPLVAPPTETAAAIGRINRDDAAAWAELETLRRRGRRPAARRDGPLAPGPGRAATGPAWPTGPAGARPAGHPGRQRHRRPLRLRGPGVPGRPWDAFGPAARGARQRCLRPDHAPCWASGSACRWPRAAAGRSAPPWPQPSATLAASS
jgi:hypothetical protein